MSGVKRRDKILIVDDSPEALGMLTDVLETADFTALVAVNGETALTLLEEITPDLILLDAVMPDPDGFETCRRIKQDARFSHIPVIFMTGLSETEHVLTGLAAGGVDYVTKPIALDELIARIRVHLGNARVTRGVQIALDATGRCLIALNENGEILWRTPHAARLLMEAGYDNNAFPADLIDKLKDLRESVKTSDVIRLGGRMTECVYLSKTGPNEFLYRLRESDNDDKSKILMEKMSLTAREGEVLIWIAAGKSNRDISEILSISPRTVNKHLEQIFRKLGIENRAAAAALAVKTLASRL